MCLQTARYKQTTFELEAAIKQRKTDVDELYDKATRCREKTGKVVKHCLCYAVHFTRLAIVGEVHSLGARAPAEQSRRARCGFEHGREPRLEAGAPKHGMGGPVR